MAFAPDYATSGRFYVYLTARAAAAQSGTPASCRCASTGARRGPRRRRPGERARCCWRSATTRPATTTAASCSSGPTGSCGSATGDGGRRRRRHAQDPASLLGKLIRLDPAAPAPEVVASGLRNPWRFSFDRATGQLVLADVGQTPPSRRSTSGVAANYGWPCFEGATRRTAATPAATTRGGAAGPEQGPHGRRVLLDHRRLRRARSRPADAARPLPLRATTAWASCARSTSPSPAGDAAIGLSVRRT